MISEIKIIKLEKLFLIDEPITLCILPYPGHPKGCPNVGKSPNCPPNAPYIENKYNFGKPYYFVVLSFNIALQKAKMKALHPKWSDKQCACCLYWQNGVRKELKRKAHECIMIYHDKYRNMDYVDFELIPEAMGLDVFKTAQYHGIPIERNPQKILYKIAFAGVVK